MTTPGVEDAAGHHGPGVAGASARDAAPARPIRMGALIWSQYTSWPELRDAASRADQAGLDDLWALDHLMPVNG